LQCLEIGRKRFFVLVLSIISMIIVSNEQDTAIHAWRSLYLFESLKAKHLDLLLTIDNTSAENLGRGTKIFSPR